jgi:hypothetical protein
LAGGHQWRHHCLRVGGIALEVWYSLRQVWLALLGSCIVGQIGAWSRDRLGRRSSGSGIFVSRSLLARGSVVGSCGARPRGWCVAYRMFRFSLMCAVLGPAWTTERRLRSLPLMECCPFLLGRMGRWLEWCTSSGPVCCVMVLLIFASFLYKRAVWVLGLSLKIPCIGFLKPVILLLLSFC